MLRGRDQTMAAVQRSDQALTAVIVGMAHHVINRVFPDISLGLVLLILYIPGSVNNDSAREYDLRTR